LFSLLSLGEQQQDRGGAPERRGQGGPPQHGQEQVGADLGRPGVHFIIILRPLTCGHSAF
jgi:hypothetical protein